MDLNINSPAYYTNQYGVNDEIYIMCREISDYVKSKQYSDIINIVGITPIVAPKEVLEQGLYKEEKKCEVKYGYASVSIQIDYEEYVNGDIDVKKQLIVNNVLSSIKSIHRKAKLDFCEFSKDLSKYCERVNIEL